MSAVKSPRPRDPARRRSARSQHATADATIEPAAGPLPEAVFDQLTGPYVRRVGVAAPGTATSEEP